MFNENDLTVENMKFFSREAALKEGVRVSELRNKVITSAFNSVKEDLSNNFGTSITLDSPKANLTEFEPNSLSGRIVATLSVDTIDGIKRVPVTFKVRASVATLAESMEEIKEKLDSTEGSLESEVRDIMASQEEKLKAKEEEEKIAKEIEADILNGLSLEASKEKHIYKEAAKEEIDMHTIQDNSLGNSLPPQILTYPKSYLPEMKKNKSIINIGGFKYKYIGDEPTMTGDTENGIIARFALIPVSKKASLNRKSDYEGEYEGWANYETWNVALWIDNDYELYDGLRDYVKSTENPSYDGLIEYLGLSGKTEDGVDWQSYFLDKVELDKWVKDMKEELNDNTTIDTSSSKKEVSEEEKRASLNVEAADEDFGSMTADELKEYMTRELSHGKSPQGELLKTVSMLPEVSAWYLMQFNDINRAVEKADSSILDAVEKGPRYALQVFKHFTKDGSDFESFPEPIKNGILWNIDTAEKFAREFPKSITKEVAERLADNPNLAASLLEDFKADNVTLNKDIKEVLTNSAKETPGYTEEKVEEYTDISEDNENLVEDEFKETNEMEETEASKKEDIEVAAKVVQKGDKWEAQSESGKGFGTYNTKEEAEERVKQMEKFKHMKKSKADIASPVQPSQATDEEVK